MILSLKLYESGPKVLREVGGPSRIRMTHRFSKSFVSVRTLLSCQTVLLLFLVQIMRRSQRTLFSVICERCGVSLRMDRPWSKLESFYTGELSSWWKKKIWATSLNESEPHESKRFPFSSHFTWLRLFRSSEKQIPNGSGRINKATARQQCSISRGHTRRNLIQSATTAVIQISHDHP